MTRSRSGLQLIAACGLAGLCGLALTACGGSGSAAPSNSTTNPATTTSTTTSTTGAAGGTAFAKYATCLRQNGATFGGFGGGPGGGTPGGGTQPTTTTPAAGTGQGRPRGGFGANLTAAQRSTFAKAQAACAKLRPAGGFGRGPGGFGGFGGGQNTQAFAAYRNCLKLHGVALTRGARPATSTTAKVRKAMSACAALRPAATTPPPATTTTTN